MSRLTPELEKEIREKISQMREWGYEKELLAELDAVRAERDELDALREELEWRRSGDTHSCHAKCKNPMCVIRRERDELRAELRRIKDAKAEDLRIADAIEENGEELEAEIARLRAEFDKSADVFEKCHEDLTECDRQRLITVKELAASQAQVVALRTVAAKACERYWEFDKTMQPEIEELQEALAATPPPDLKRVIERLVWGLKDCGHNPLKPNAEGKITAEDIWADRCRRVASAQDALAECSEELIKLGFEI